MMHYLKFILWLINVKTIVFFTLSYILYKFIIDQYYCNPQWKRIYKELPGPREYPIGNFLPLMIGARDGIGILFTRYMKIYGSKFRLRIGKYLAVICSDVDDVQTILTNSQCLEKNEIEIFKSFFGNGLPFAYPVSAWKQKRKTYQPFFMKNNLFHRIQEMNELNDKYIEKMKKEVDGPEFDLKNYMKQLSFDSIMKTLFDFEISDQDRKEVNFCERIDEAFMRLSLSFFFPSPLLKAIMQLVKPVDIIKTKRILHNFIDKVLISIPKSSNGTNGREEMKATSFNKENFVQSFISKVTRLEEELGEAELVHSDLLAFIIGGTDTVGITMSFCFLALAAHPEIQEKVYEEIYQVFGDDDRPADASDLNKFPYLEQVIKETQRLFTIIPVTMRNVTKNIKIGSYVQPAGTLTGLNFAGIHHNPNIYPNPYSFNPDNFTAEAIRNRHRYSFIPFSAGPRNCIGKEYAEMNMKLTLISFLRVYTFWTKTKLENVKQRAGIVEISSTGYFISIKLRKKNLENKNL